MAIHKSVETEEELVKLIGRMGKVEEYQESLQSLQSIWDNLTLLGHLSGTGADMRDTRQAFQQLTTNLLSQLGRETLKKTVLAMRSKAQVAIDIMVRNLFERTADIGFLAMDDDVRSYIGEVNALRAKPGADDCDIERLQTLNSAMTERLHEYTGKYSVYSNIILLDTAGNLLVQLDKHSRVEHSADPLLQEALSTSRAYVETFRPTDLLPGQGNSLLYSYRVTTADGKTPLGVLCLCFRFANEAEGIFSNLLKQGDWSIATLLDARGEVIASCDPYHIPVGARLPLVRGADWEVVRFAGREYLAASCPTQGYQGYMGPGWYGHVMLPLDHAFECEAELDLKKIPANVLAAVMSNPSLFSDALREIPGQAAKIQRGLNRSVWNGNVNQRRERKALTPAFSKVLLWEISSTGFKTQDVFEHSISNLHQTVVSSILQDSRFQAALAIDIMDRNLYERANDCRWWAQAGVFRQFLGTPGQDRAALLAVQKTLAHINSLYTVYDNLVLFDRQGRIVAVSNPQYQECCGNALGEEWVQQTLALQDGQSYTVSPFAPSPLYQNRHTYIYAAAIRTPDNGQVVGGIGIVFDAAPQFNSMLTDALPVDESGAVPAGCFGVFADREKHIIASTRDELKPGDTLALDDGFFRIDNGAGISSITEFAGQYYAVGASMSKGYREYKGGKDAYQNDVVALIFVPLGNKGEDRRDSTTRRSRVSGVINGGNGVDNMEIATFYVDNNWFGIHSEYVVEAIDASGITRVPGSSDGTCGYMMFRGNVIPVIGLWGIINKEARRRSSQEPQIVVLSTLRENDGYLGIMVDDLGEIPEIPLHRIEKISSMLAGNNLLAESLVKPESDNPQEEMIVVLSPERIRQRFVANG